MKITAKECEARLKGLQWVARGAAKQEVRMRFGLNYTSIATAYALGYLAGQRDAQKKRKVKK